MRRILFFTAFLTFFLFNSVAQGAITHPLGDIENAENQIGRVIKYKGHRNYSFTERSDLRVYLNGRYLGLQSKQVGAFIIPSMTGRGLVYEGDFFVNQDTNRNQMQVAAGIHEAIPSSFIISDDGKLTMLRDNGYPSFRSFPAYSVHGIKKGDVWQAQATRAVDPLSKGIVTKMPIFVQYTYTGDDYFNGEAVYLITAQWATRYGMNSTTHYIDFGGDKELDKAAGTHKATLIVSKASGAALVIRDTVDETFYYTDGNYYQFKGTISLFTEYPPAVDRSRLVDAIKRIVRLDDEEADALRQPLGGDTGGGGTGSWDDKVPGASDGDVPRIAAGVGSAGGGDAGAGDIRGGGRKTEDSPVANKGGSGFRPSVPKPVKNGHGISVENTDAGIRLTMQNLQFKADSAELLPGEEQRLNQIAEILGVAENCQFLVEGHTASTGYEEGEMKLSIERARSIAEALSKKGIALERFICKGSGGTKPVAPNTTAEGKALNRRVEITILE